MSKHTKGPWKPSRNSNYVDGDTNADDATTICEVFAYPEQAANAALIAAAPDLLKACELLRHRLWTRRTKFSDQDHDAMNAGSAAIDRAEPKL